MSERYEKFLETRSKKQWQKIGLARRAGVATPLFSIYSEKSVGIGELPDLKLLVDWCKLTGMSIIQLLPMNDVGFDFRPYDSQSSFALEPMYLSLENLSEVSADFFKTEIDCLRKKFPAGAGKVNYAIKAKKLEVLWKIFKYSPKKSSHAFQQFVRQNSFWIKDYALFKVIKETNGGKSWEEWEPALRNREESALKAFESKFSESLLFHMWLQWQLFEQFLDTKKYAERKGVLFMGDLPLLVSRDSADVWAHQDYFKLDAISGAPPDAFFAKGQRWGMPPYRWEAIAKNRDDYVIQKLKYAQNFYDLFRIDHVVGIFRIWTIPSSEPYENGGLNGTFDPRDEHLWEEHGRRILSTMVDHAKMLACAEDLGVVPDCSYKVLDELGIIGMDVVRWKKNWKTDFEFSTPENYRPNSITVFSTHDMTSLAGWWEFEAGTVDEMMFARKCESRGLDFGSIKTRLFDLGSSSHGRLRWKQEIKDTGVLQSVLGRPEHEVKDFLDLHRETYDEKNRFWNYLGLNGKMQEKFSPSLTEAVLRKASKAASIFGIQLLQDWLSLSDDFHFNAWEFRINFPGVVTDSNWTLAVPFSLEKMLKLPMHKTIQNINSESNRI